MYNEREKRNEVIRSSVTNCFTDRFVDSLLVRYLYNDLSTRKNVRQTEETQQSQITGGRDKGKRGCIPFCGCDRCDLCADRLN